MNLENEFGRASEAVDAITARVVNPEDKENVSAVFEGIPDDTVQMFAGWEENMKNNSYPTESLRQQFDIIAEQFAYERDITGPDNPEKEKHLEMLAIQAALAMRMAATKLGIDGKLLNEVIPFDEDEGILPLEDLE